MPVSPKPKPASNEIERRVAVRYIANLTDARLSTMLVAPTEHANKHASQTHTSTSTHTHAHAHTDTRAHTHASTHAHAHHESHALTQSKMLPLTLYGRQGTIGRWPNK